MNQTFEVESIMYGRKETDKGIILGRRPWKWTLRNKYNPCYAKDTQTKEHLSCLSKHKQNFMVYIPAAHLEVGKEIFVVNHEYKGVRKETTLKIVNVTPQFIDAEILETREVEKQHADTQAFTPQTAENVFGGETYAPPIGSHHDAKNEVEDYAWKAADMLPVEYLADAEDLNFDTFEVEASENFEEYEEEAEEVIEPAHTQQEAFPMAKPQAFSFVMNTSPKHQKNIFGMICRKETKKNAQTDLSDQEIRERYRKLNNDFMSYKFGIDDPKAKEWALYGAEMERRGLNLYEDTPKQPEHGLTPQEIAILTALNAEKELHIDALTAQTGFSVQSVSSTLFMLELSGKVKQLCGMRFALAS